MLTRNRLANVSFFVCSIGELVVLAILAGILQGIITDDPDSNTRALSIVCAYSAGVWSESEPRFLPALLQSQNTHCRSGAQQVVSACRRCDRPEVLG